MTSVLRERGEELGRHFSETTRRLGASGHIEGTACAELDRRLKEIVEQFRAIRRVDDAWWTAVHQGRTKHVVRFAKLLTTLYRRWQGMVCRRLNGCIDRVRREQPDAELEHEADFRDCCQAVDDRLSGAERFPANWRVRTARAGARRSAATPEQADRIRRAARAGGKGWATAKSPAIELPTG